MKKFICWVRNMPVAPHYWWAFVLVVFALAVTWMCGWSEKASRLSGMCLQLGGVLTVVWGLLKTRADFGQPTVRLQLRSWFKEFSKWPPPAVLHVDPSESGSFGRGYLISTSSPSADQTVEGRVKHLESIVKKVEERQSEMHNAILKAEEKAQRALDAQVRQLVGQIADVSKKIETTATGGVHVSGAGVVLLFFGTIFGGVAPDLHEWMVLLGLSY